MSTVDATRFRLITDALEGAGVFRPAVTYQPENDFYSVSRTALVRNTKESLRKFAERNRVACYENHLLSACTRFVGYLAKRPALRDLDTTLFNAFAADCDWRGNALDVFWHSFMIQAKARGSMLLLVDNVTDVSAQSVSAQIDSREFPYLTMIKPEDVTDFRLDIRGRLAMIEYHVTWDGAPALKGWDSATWWVRVGEKVVQRSEHNLGMTPVLAFTETGQDFPSFGEFAQIADLSLRLFNANSDLDSLIRDQTFSVLAFHIGERDNRDISKALSIELGTSNAITYFGDAPAYVAPPDGPASVHLQKIAKLEESIRRVSLTVEQPENQQAESGIALSIRFQALNASLTSFARRMEDFERQTLAVVCRYLGLPDSAATTQWAKDFAIADLTQELNNLLTMQAAGMPDEAIRQQKRQVASIAFSTAPTERQDAILAEIDAEEQERAPGLPETPDPEDDPETGA